MSFEFTADFTDVTPANRRFCKTDGYYKVRFAYHEVYPGDSKDRVLLYAQILEPRESRNQILRDGFNTPNKFTDAAKAKQYLKWWKAALLSIGIPEKKIKKSKITWPTFKDKIAYADFVAGNPDSDGDDQWDDTVWITEAQYQKLTEAEAELEDDEEVEIEEEEEDEEVEEEDEEVEVEEEEEEEPPPPPKKKTTRRRRSTKKTKAEDPLAAADSL